MTSHTVTRRVAYEGNCPKCGLKLMPGARDPLQRDCYACHLIVAAATETFELTTEGEIIDRSIPRGYA